MEIEDVMDMGRETSSLWVHVCVRLGGQNSQDAAAKQACDSWSVDFPMGLHPAEHQAAGRRPLSLSAEHSRPLAS